ncbi:hypothetical protein [Methylosinus sp. KRF6]|uniref:hypothetical protein n=1 Tax=Methylosinus sp. KRF6 TaxID=2846853 RepID=UPI001C0B2C43|nr:hypothetical protein [Methylosinus sp. KRF6]MBU3887592.1 hypothetical protein [Methylosinus sp. KRF6]
MFATVITAIAGLIAVIVTATLTRRREHEADWRKLKLAQYQQFILALSGIVEGRSTPESMRQWTDAVNAMSLIAPMSVLKALRAYQEEVSFTNQHRTREAHDRLLNALLRELRRDIHPSGTDDDLTFTFWLQALPPES